MVPDVQVVKLHCPSSLKVKPTKQDICQALADCQIASPYLQAVRKCLYTVPLI